MYCFFVVLACISHREGSYSYLFSLHLSNHFFMYTTYFHIFCPSSSFFSLQPIPDFLATHISPIFLTTSSLFLSSTHPNHLNILSHLFRLCSLLLKFLYYSFLIRSNQVTPYIHLSILISVTSIFISPFIFNVQRSDSYTITS